MAYLNFKSKYETHPTTKIVGHKAIQGYDAIAAELAKKIEGDTVLTLDYYVGVREDEVKQLINALNPTTVIEMIDIFKDGKDLTEQMKYNLTDDRVFGKMYYGDMIDFIDLDKLAEAKEKVANAKGLTIICGVGASLVSEGDINVYFDLARWEATLRLRKSANYKCDNADEDNLRKYKRAFFIEWRICDKHKNSLFKRFDYVVDTNKENDPKMITGETFLDSLKQIVRRPFRTVPYFDPGVWGGQWMKEVCNLDPTPKNYAWSFDGVPEENSILFDYDGVIVELPSMDAILYQPKELLGPKNFSRFGAEYPIRFDFLDTIEGQHLSLQVHPLVEYAKKQFGLTYTQDESYYILDAVEGATVYLGLKEGINPDEMIDDLRKAEKGGYRFPDEKYINCFPAKKHDHFLIPAGTCHCSGSGAMVLEISATPYIFTFKLWDWDRLGLDGRPRPVHIEHGKEVIQWDRTTPWVEENLVNAFYDLDEDCGASKVEHTGLHELEFIETRRYTTKGITRHNTNNCVNQLNLIDGKEAIVESVDGSFEPLVVHYAETFVIPAAVGEYTIRPYGDSEGEEIMFIKAHVRGSEM